MDMADKFLLTILGRLDEAQARWYVAREALALGRGGVATMEKLTGISRPRILRGIRELKEDNLPPEERVRRVGGGRKRLEQHDPKLMIALEKIMGESTAGDPMSPLRWTHKSTRTIADELNRQGHAVSHATVGHKLDELGYSMQSNRKDKEGLSPPERDRQFLYINDQVRKFVSRGDPVISVDSKKKEKVGEFKNPGKTWLPKGQPKKVLSKDFRNLASGTAIPYGTYDPERNEGFVNVGISNETAEFAVASVRRWWKLVGCHHYPKAKRLLICADAGGGNGSRRRGWKYHLQELANESRITVTVCHYPPGTSKWNKIEHRMFSFISMNWQGEPLVSYETVLNLISGTKTRTGLHIKAKLDTRQYETGIEITDTQMRSVNLEPHKIHPDWNYTIASRPTHKTRHTEHSKT